MREILTLVFKHRLTILGVFLFIVLSVTAISFVLPPTYEAESVLLVKVGREYLDGRENGNLRSTMEVKEITNSEIKIIRSRDLIEGVIHTIGLGRIYPGLVTAPPNRLAAMDAALREFSNRIGLGRIYPGPVTAPPNRLAAMDAALREFSNRMSASPVKESNVIEIKFRHGDPSIAAEAVNLLVERFKEKRLELLADPSASFLEEQVAVYRQRLVDREEQVEKFKRQHGVSSLSDQRRLLLQQRADLEMSIKNTQSQIVELAQRASALRDQMRNAPKTVPLSSRLPASFFEQFEADALRAEAERRSLEVKANAIHGQTVVVGAELSALDLLEKELQQLTREMSLKDSDYRRYADKREEARIAEALERERVGNVRVVQRAVVPAEPVTPRKTLNIAVAIVLGAVCSLGVAFLSERLRDAPGTPRAVERGLGLPVLAVIPSTPVAR
jgi:uncharacterized protein involved in exopolysaccharide biosynthesis